MRTLFGIFMASTFIALVACKPAKPVYPQITMLELVILNDDGTRDGDAFAAPDWASIADCEKAKYEIIADWKNDHPHAVLVEAFCESRPDPKAVLEYHLKNGDIKRAAPAASSDEEDALPPKSAI